MLKNHIVIALRQLRKQKFYAGINIIGLAVGVACCLLISLNVLDELSFDRHHKHAERIYRVALDINMNNSTGMGTCIPPALAPALERDLPEIEKAARLNPYFLHAGSNYVRKQTETQNSYENDFVYVDAAFFDLFDLPLVEGKGQMNEPFKMVITEKIANKFFPNISPIGETLILNDDPEAVYEITGVVENVPTNSHFQYDYFMSLETLDSSTSTDFVSNNYYAYVMLSPGAKAENLEQKLIELSNQYIGPQFKERFNIDFSTFSETGMRYHVALQPLTDIHLKSTGFAPQLKENGDIRYVWLFGAVAIFILFIAMVNFVNLSTARSSNRAKEVGVRKVIGSLRNQLIGQFLTESILISFMAIILGIFLAEMGLSFYNNFLGKTLSIPFANPLFLISVIAIGGLIGILAGIYPSFYLSAFKPIKVLKGNLSRGTKSGWLRSGLVVFQFAISMALIAATLIVTQQMNFIQEKKLGFEKDQILLIEDAFTLGDRLPSFKQSLRQLPEVKNVTVNGFLPLAKGNRNSLFVNAEGQGSGSEQVAFQIWPADEDYLNTLGIELIVGRGFDDEIAADSQAIIVNQKAVSVLGYTEDPIGKQVQSEFFEQPRTIIGVVEDFHFESLKSDIESLGLVLGENHSTMAIKTSAVNMEQLIAKSEQLWTVAQPNTPFRYAFMDERFETMYHGERQMGATFTIFAILAIFIACLGLFALAAFMAEQRRKEIGIRKVLGASIESLVLTLSKNFLIPVMIAFFVAVPAAWYFMSGWLADFAYAIDLHWSVFLLAAVLSIGIAFVTVSFQSIKAALAHPIESLKNE